VAIRERNGGSPLFCHGIEALHQARKRIELNPFKDFSELGALRKSSIVRNTSPSGSAELTASANSTPSGKYWARIDESTNMRVLGQRE